MEKRYQRVLEIAPGLLIWLLLVFPIIGSIFIPQVVGFFFLVLTLYLFYKSILTLAGMIVGYATYRYSMKKNWLKECQRLDYAHLPDLNLLPVSSTLPKHLIVIANYGEDYSVVYRTMKAITEENYPKELIYVAFSIEERKAVVDEEYRRREGYLRRDFGEYFADRFFFFIHPADMDGEVPGAASNRTWAAKHAVEILEAKGCDIGEFLVTAPDGDTVFHPDYLASVTYKWLTAQKRNNKFYQTGIYRFNNNYWRVPTLIRILSMDLTLQTLGSSVFETKSKETFSCYTLNLRVLKEAHYWDVSLPIDDSIFFWRAFNHFNGEWECVVFFTPIDNDAVHADNYLLAYMKQYQ